MLETYLTIANKWIIVTDTTPGEHLDREKSPEYYPREYHYQRAVIQRQATRENTQDNQKHEEKCRTAWWHGPGVPGRAITKTTGFGCQACWRVVSAEGLTWGGPAGMKPNEESCRKKRCPLPPWLPRSLSALIKKANWEREVADTGCAWLRTLGAFLKWRKGLRERTVEHTGEKGNGQTQEETRGEKRWCIGSLEPGKVSLPWKVGAEQAAEPVLSHLAGDSRTGCAMMQDRRVAPGPIIIKTKNEVWFRAQQNVERGSVQSTSWCLWGASEYPLPPHAPFVSFIMISEVHMGRHKCVFPTD